MITSALHSPWTSDVRIKNLKICGLEKPSAIRFKLFSIDNRLIKTRIGKLSVADKSAAQEAASLLFKELLMMQ
jgi:mRNA interferase MazF